MKIKDKLLLSFVAILVVIIATNLIFVNRTVDHLSQKSIDHTSANMEILTSANYHLAENILSDFGEQIVELTAKNAALDISIILSDINTDNFSDLRNNKILRSKGTSKLTIDNKEIGYLAITVRGGESLLHPDPQIEGTDLSTWQIDFPELWSILQEAFNKGFSSGYYSFFNENGEVIQRFMAMTQIPGTDFIVNAVVNIDHFFVPVQETIESIGNQIKDSAIERTTFSTNESKLKARNSLLIIYIFIIIITIILSYQLAMYITKPVISLRNSLNSLSNGEIDTKAEIKGALETRQLAECFNDLTERLQKYIIKVKAEISARQTIESELNIASEIQKNILPTTFPPFPERDEFDLYAFMQPAKVIGGDFYDFLLREDRKLVMVIADVSGKGVPAALFMMVCRTLLNSLSRSFSDPAQILEKANNILCQHNETGMFVTIFLISYDFHTGVFSYSNGGHSPAIIAGKDYYREITTENSTALGFIQNIKYQTKMDKLEFNESILLYTDGVLDACDTQENFFGMKRLTQILLEKNNLTCKNTIQKINEQLDLHQCSNQFDDITMLLMKKTKED